MASELGSSIRGCLLILLVVGLLTSSDEGFVSAAADRGSSSGHAVGLLVSNEEGFVSAAAGKENGHFETVPLSYILGETDRSSSSGHAVYGHDERRPFLEVVHNPNSQHLDRSEMLTRDEARVKWLQSKMIPVHHNDMMKSNVLSSLAVSVPVSAEFTIRTAQYVVNVGLGNPIQKLQLEIDTGSSITWTQCKPCQPCYNQTDPIFDPSASSTYSNIPCPSSNCSNFYGGNPQTCTSNGACRFYVHYNDMSYTTGPFATETLTLTSTVNLPKYIFGCGQNTTGFNDVDGILGLSNDGLFSMVTQGASRFGRYFSYCLPSTTNTTGFLTFGNTNSTGFSFTPMTSVPGNSAYYGINITGISVGGVNLSPSSSSILMNSNPSIDSGTVITRLPQPVYSEVRSAFRKQMTQYPMVSGDGFLDTCYDFRNYSNVTYPSIVISFSGGVNVSLKYSGIFFVDSPSQVCLAFAQPPNGSTLVLYGNVQQRTFEVAYDVANKKLGFRPNACT